MAKAKEEALTYSEAKQRLEEILEQLQTDRLSVDDLSKSVREAVELIELCKAKLRSVDEELDKIMNAER